MARCIRCSITASSTGALFLLVGLLYERRHSLEIADYGPGGLATVAPWLATAFLITTLASIGLPVLKQLRGRVSGIAGVAAANFTWTVWAATGAIFAACYMLWLYQRVFYGEAGNEVRHHVPDMKPREWAAIVPLIVMMCGVGVVLANFLPPVS